MEYKKQKIKLLKELQSLYSSLLFVFRRQTPTLTKGLYSNRFHINKSVDITAKKFRQFLEIYLILFVISWILFQIFVTFQFKYLNGYLRQDLKLGPYVDFRYQIDWFLFFIFNFRIIILVPATLSITEGYILFQKNFLFYFLTLYAIFDLCCFFYFLFVVTPLCNTGNYDPLMCNSPLSDYCSVYGATKQYICPIPIGPPAPKSTLGPRFEFQLWFYFTIGYFFAELLGLSIVSGLTETIKNLRNNLSYAPSDLNY